MRPLYVFTYHIRGPPVQQKSETLFRRTGEHRFFDAPPLFGDGQGLNPVSYWDRSLHLLCNGRDSRPGLQKLNFRRFPPLP